MTVKEAFDKFIESRVLSGSKPKTIACYSQTVSPYILFIGSDNSVTDITRDSNNKYIAGLYMQRLSKASISSYIRQLKVFLRWIEDEYEINCCAKKIKVPKSPKKLVHIYTDDEIRKIFESVDASEEWIIVRNRAIIALMLDSGLRQNEVCTLKRINISWSDSTLTVFGKGDKERVVPFGKLSRHFMTEYDKLCPYKHAYFFASQKGGIVTCNAVKLLMHKIAEKLPFPFASHRLRHNFATNYCLDHYEKYGQVDIYKLMVIMGHEDIETTRKYLHHANSILASRSNISHLDKIMNL